MRAEIGDKVVTGTGFDYCVVIIAGRTANTIETKFLNGSTRDRRANPRYFRAYDKAKVDRLLQLDEEINAKKEEQRDLYQSLARIE